jgi:hypothetical protein
MPIRKYTDWSNWFLGLRQNLLKCIGTTGTTWLGTNAATAAGIPIIGITWKQACVMFGVHIGFEVFSYLQKVQPEVIVETIETQHITRTDASGGSVETGQTKTTTTTTPVEPKQP